MAVTTSTVQALKRVVEANNNLVENMFLHSNDNFRCSQTLKECDWVVIDSRVIMDVLLSKVHGVSFGFKFAYRGRSSEVSNGYGWANMCGIWHKAQFKARCKDQMIGMVVNKQIAVPAQTVKSITNKLKLHYTMEPRTSFVRENDRKISERAYSRTLCSRVTSQEGLEEERRKCKEDPLYFAKMYGGTFFVDDLEPENKDSLFKPIRMEWKTDTKVDSACLTEMLTDTPSSPSEGFETSLPDDIINDVIKTGKKLLNYKGEVMSENTKEVVGFDVAKFLKSQVKTAREELNRVIRFVGADPESLSIEDSIALAITEKSSYDYLSILLDGQVVVRIILDVSHEKVTAQVWNILESKKNMDLIWRENNRGSLKRPEPKLEPKQKQKQK